MRQLKITKSITNRQSASLERYLQEINRDGMIPMDEEIRLARRIREGDEEALEKLVRANLRFVVSVAKQYQNQGLSLSDLINEGNVGLMKAAKRFDETRGFKFISYAVWWIRQSILQSLAEQSRAIRIPLNQVGALSKINRAYNDFVQQNERTPSSEELAEILDMYKERVEEALRSSARLVSVDAPLSDDDEGTLIDNLVGLTAEETESGLAAESLTHDIKTAIASLDTRSREVLSMFYGIDGPELSLDEIGERIGLSRERVRQVRERALVELRCSDKNKSLRSYLG